MKALLNMRALISMFALMLILTSCEEKDKTQDNPAPTNDNVLMKFSLVYDGMGIPKDSAITNNLGQRFFIEHVTLVFSDFRLKDGPDTTAYYREPFVLSSSDPSNAIMEIPTGGYSVNYAIRFGIDSAATADIVVNGVSNDSELKDVPVLRSDANGIDHAIIEGRMFDPADPNDSIGNIQLSYRLGTTELSRIETSQQRNFSVQGDKSLSIVVQVDIARVFQDMDMAARPVVTTDPQNLVDYNLAKLMAANLEIELF